MVPKKKKSSKKPVQATLGELVGEKKGSRKTKARKTTGKKTSTESAASKTKAKQKTVKKPVPKSTKKKESPKTKKKASSSATKRKQTKAPPKLEGPPFTTLPGVGSRLSDKLLKAGYTSIEKLSKARANALAKKIEGLSKDGAIRLITEAKRAIVDTAKPPEDDVDQDRTRPSLTDLPGVGMKLAKALESAGYNSISRLSRAHAEGLAARVDGLGKNSAVKLIAAAKKYIKERERSIVFSEPPAPTVATPAKTAGTKPKKAPKKVPKKESAIKTKEPEPPAKPAKAKLKKPKKSSKKSEEAPVKKTKRKPAPKRKKSKIIRKKSGLKVPKAVETLAKTMKTRWAEVEKMEEDGTLPSGLPETVEVVSLGVQDTTNRLVETAMEVLNEALVTGRPAFEIPSRSSDNIVWDEFRDLLLLGMKTVNRPYHSLASVVDATRTARVMEIIYQLLRSNLHATKREVFYSDVNLFRDQKYSDKIIEDVSSMLNTTRDSVHIVASARGSAMGRVIIRDGGDIIDLTKMGTGGWAITPFLDQVEIVESDAEFILVAEKDAAVMRLAEAKYWNRQPCIVLTGKGSGDMATRAFLKQLVKELEIPAFALVDSDPYGHYIYSVFLRGSKRLSYESPFIATPELKLLGVLSRDLDAFNIPKSVRIPMEPADIKRVREMLKEPFVQKNKEWVQDLKLMLQMKEKAEIQAFASHSFEYLTDEYLPQKLETGDWI